MISSIKKREDLGTVSFAILGVLIILLSIFAAAYISRLDRINYENELRADKLSSLERDAEETLDSIEERIKSIGTESAFKAGMECEVNVSEYFSTRIDEYMEKRKTSDEYQETSLEVDGYDLTIESKTVQVDDIVPESQDEEIENDGPGHIKKSNRTFCYEVNGQINISAVRDGLTLDKTRDIGLMIDVPYPFLRNKMDNFQTSLRGDKSHVGRMTEYILTTLAQYRTLTGYGMRPLPQEEDSVNYRPTDDIITEDDVELALNLALLFEIACEFRAYDPDHIDSIIENSSFVNYRRIEQVLKTYLKEESIDPGDIISLFHGLSYDDEVISEDESVEINIPKMVGQAMNALIDQFILVHMDNTDSFGLVDRFFKGIRDAQDMMGSITDLISGDDDDEINPREVQLVKNWVRSVFISSGFRDTSLFLNYYGIFDRFRGETIQGYPDLSEDSFEFMDKISYKARLDSDDHQWYRYTCGHGGLHRKSGETCDKNITVGGDDEEPIKGICGAQEELAGYDYRVGEVKYRINHGPVAFQPYDILQGNDILWQEFYNDAFQEEVDQEPEEIRDVIEDIILKIMDMMMADDNIQDIIDEYNNIRVDPTDDKSFMNNIQTNVDSAIENVIGHFRENPDEIASILGNELHEDGDPKVDDLIFFLHENYDELVHGPEFIDGASARTSKAMTDEYSPYLEIIEESEDIIKGGVNDPCDMAFDEDREVNKGEVSKLIRYGGELTEGVVEEIYQDLKDPIGDIYEEVKEREIYISDSEENVSDEDGLIIQALNDYQYNTSYQTQTGSGSLNSVCSGASIQEISPDPATREQDTVFFHGNSTFDHTEIEWISDIDGHLSNKETFNRSARFMSPGEHEITFMVQDQDGFVHEDQGSLVINIPPTAEIEKIDPVPASELEKVTFSDSSWDEDGDITERDWCFGDGNTSHGEKVNHVYKEPGNYTVTLEVEDDMGGTDSTSKSILIDDVPRVEDIYPDNDEPWDTYTDIEITFSEEVDPDSLVYSMTPDLDFHEHWCEDNSTVVLVPEKPYQRDQVHILNIEDVDDVDNGTTSSLPEPVSYHYSTMEHGQVTEIHPDTEDEVNLGSSIILVFDEEAYLEDPSKLVNQDWNWSFSWENDNTYLRLDHDGFPPASDIELNFDLDAVKAVHDDSPFRRGEDDHISMEFRTEYIDKPYLISAEPENGSEEIELDTSIELEFDKSMNTSTFELILTPGVKNISQEWNQDNTSVSIKHDGFSSSKEYKMFVKARCIDGFPLHVPRDEDITNPIKFTTMDDYGLKVVNISPQDGTEHYLSNAPITIQFNQRIDEESLEFVSKPNPGGWFVDLDTHGTTLMLYHHGYPAGSEVEFTLKNVLDFNGNELEEEVSVEFKISDNGENIEGNLFQRKLWSFIGGGPFGESLFDLTEAFLRETTGNMIYSSEMSNLEYRTPMKLDDNFEYSPSEAHPNKELELLVKLDPGFIPLEDIISDPTGHHYTDVTKISSRPFKTEWDIAIPDQEISLDVSQKDPYVIEDQELSHLSFNETYNVGFNSTISVASGWALDGVEYTRDDLDLSTILNFLDKVWELVKRPLSYLLDGLYKVLELFRDLVNRVKEYAESLIRYLGNMIQELVKEALSPLVELILDNRDVFENFGAVLSLLGIGLEVDVYEDGKEMDLPNTCDQKDEVFLHLDVGGGAFGTSLDLDLFVLETNVVSTGQLSSDSMDLLWQIDPLAKEQHKSIYDGWFQTQGKFGEEGDGAILELMIPDIDKHGDPEDETFGYSVEEIFPPISAVTIPIGPVVVSNFDFGIEISYIDMENITSSLIYGSIKGAFLDTVEYMRDTSISFDFITDFVRTFSELLVEELFRFLKEVLNGIEVFFSCTINQIDVILSFGITTGEGIIDFVRWIGQKVRHLIQSIGDRRPSSAPEGLPSSVLESTELSIETGFQDGVTVDFSANVPALASLVGKDLGRWEIGFGLEVADDLDLVDGSLVQW